MLGALVPGGCQCAVLMDSAPPLGPCGRPTPPDNTTPCPVTSPLPGLLRSRCVRRLNARGALVRWVPSGTLRLPSLTARGLPSLVSAVGLGLSPLLLSVCVGVCWLCGRRSCLLSVWLSRHRWCRSAWVCAGMVARGWSCYRRGQGEWRRAGPVGAGRTPRPHVGGPT